MQYVKFDPLPLVNMYLEKWADEIPDVQALVQYESGEALTYREMSEKVDLYAMRLLKMGVQKGDRVATMWFQSIEHIILLYACFKIGAMMAPLDIRLQPAEVIRDLKMIKPRLFFIHGKTVLRDFMEIGQAVLENCSFVDQIIQFNGFAALNSEIMSGAVEFTELFSQTSLEILEQETILNNQLAERYATIETTDPGLIIFTTGTTGQPKPAMLQHECIIAQNESGIRLSDLRGSISRLICNMPVSHVAGNSETVMTILYTGGTAILLHIFDPVKTMEAIEKHKPTWLGMVPVMYRMIWALPNYKDYDLSSLHSVIYAGASVDEPFLHQLATMAPNFGTALGMTENGGIATATPIGISVNEMLGQVGRYFDDIAKISVRRPMNADNTAGEELPDGELGEICYHAPLVFKGYFGMPEETAATLTPDGILYTGDMGYFKDMGTYRALYLGGRRKFMIKQKGYNVFPDEVAAHIALISEIDQVEIVGAPHKLFDEGIIAFVIPKQGASITSEQILEHCKAIAAYKRPQYVHIMDELSVFPVNRTGKVDKMEMIKLAGSLIIELRQQGLWDA